MSLFGLFERRANIENPAVPLTDLSLLGLFGGQPTDSGVPVTEYTAMNMSAVYRATSLLSGLGGSLPLRAINTSSKEQVDGSLVDDPHPELTPFEFWQLSYVHRCLWGNFFAQKVYSKRGAIAWLHPLAPIQVRVGRAKPIPANPSGKVFQVIDDMGRAQPPMTPFEIFHIPGLGYDGLTGVSPVRMAAQAIGMAQAAEGTAARLFRSGNLLSGLLQTDAVLDQSKAETLQKRWQQKFSGIDGAHKVAVLDSGAKFQSLTMPADDAQMLQSRDFQVTEMARFFGIPPYLLMQTEKSTSWGTGLEQQALGFANFDLSPRWLAPTEARITKELLPKGQHAKYGLESLLRGDSIARAEFYQVMRNVGAYCVDEIRAYEDLPPLADGAGATYLQPTIQAPLGSDEAPTSLGPADGG